jgi:hypothetical protein
MRLWPEPEKRGASIGRASDATATLRREWQALIASSSAPVPQDRRRDEAAARLNLRRAIAAYVDAWRADAATPERMLVDLKAVLNDVTAGLEPEVRRAVVEEIVGLAIEEYYRARPSP